MRFFDPRCTCRFGARCTVCRERGRAHLRMYRLARGVDRYRQPVEYANQQTSMHDGRTALCLTMGVRMEHIDPTTGHDRTPFAAASSSAGGER